MELETKLVMGKKIGDLASPINFSTIGIQSFPGVADCMEYGRFDNTTRLEVENELAKINSVKHALLFSSGMAAITTVFLSLKSGDHIICSKNIYDGTRRVLEKIFSQFKIQSTFVSTEEEAILSFRANTKIIWFESLSNPLLRICNIEKLSEFVKDKKCILVIDATFTPPSIMDPFKLGADVVIHSVSKFISGHHDVIGGLILSNNKKLIDNFRFIQQNTGNILSPFDCFLLIRGVKTLDVRLKKQTKNAMKLANFFNKEKMVEKVIFPGLKNHIDNKIAKKNMNSFGSIITIILKKKINVFFKKLNIVKVSHSFGGFSTTIQVPRKMITFSNTNKELDDMGITNNLLRISVGIEDINDLINDFKKALN